MLDGPSGHTHCSRFNRTKLNNTTNGNNPFNNFDKNVSVSSVFSVFNSVFNKRDKNFNNFKNFNKNNKTRRRHHCHNSSLHIGIGLGLGRVSANIRGGFGLGGCIPYARYRNAKTRNSNNSRAYPAYGNDNAMVHGRRAVLNAVRAEAAYPAYNNRNGVVGGGYGRYTNRNVMCNRRMMAMGVPGNITRNVRLSVKKGKGTNGRGNIPKSLLVLMRRRRSPGLVHSRGSLVCGLLLDFPATTLNNTMRVPAVSKGIGMGVSSNARPKGILHLHNGNLPGIGKCNAKSLLMGIDMCMPRALGGSRGGTLRRVRRSSGFGPGASVGRGVFGGFGDLFS